MNQMTDTATVDGEKKATAAVAEDVALRAMFSRTPKATLIERAVSMEIEIRALRRDRATALELRDQARETAGKATELKNEWASKLDSERRRSDQAEREAAAMRRDLETVREERDRARGYIDRILEDDAISDGAAGSRQVHEYQPKIVSVRRGPRQQSDPEIPF